MAPVFAEDASSDIQQVELKKLSIHSRERDCKTNNIISYESDNQSENVMS